jgi:hypothetical protein
MGKKQASSDAIDQYIYEKIEGTDACTLMGMEFPEPNWVVENMIPEGVIIFAGKPKAGKSVLALNIAVAVALGGKCLGQDVEKGGVLYLHLEDNQRRIQRRIKAMLPLDEYSGGISAAPNNLYLYHKWPRIGEGGLRALDNFLKENRSRLVIIDTFKMFQPHLTKKDNKKIQYEIDYDRVSSLREIAERHRTTIKLIMHARKQASEDPIDLISGTLGISGAVDSVMVLYDRRGKRAKLFVQGRDVDSEVYAVVYSPECWTWYILGKQWRVQATESQQAVLDFITENSSKKNPVSPTEIADGSGIKRNYVAGKILPKLLKDGLIEKVGRGKYYAVDASDVFPGNEGEKPDNMPKSIKNKSEQRDLF